MTWYLDQIRHRRVQMVATAMELQLRREYTRLRPNRPIQICIGTYIREKDLFVMTTAVYPTNGRARRTEKENATMLISDSTALAYQLVR